MSKKSDLGRLAERAAKGQKTVLGLPGQTRVSPGRAAEILNNVMPDPTNTGVPVVELEKAELKEIDAAGAGSAEPVLASNPPEQPVPPAPAAPQGIPAYVLAKRYVPKTERNTKTWNAIVQALTEGPKTLGQLTEIVKDHKDFVGYMVRNGHIAPQANA
jgi:hypothetical protein